MSHWVKEYSDIKSYLGKSMRLFTPRMREVPTVVALNPEQTYHHIRGQLKQLVNPTDEMMEKMKTMYKMTDADTKYKKIIYGCTWHYDAVGRRRPMTFYES